MTHSSENGNDVTLVGNVTSDPELRFTATGQATASFGLAVNRVWTDRQVSWFLRTPILQVGDNCRGAVILSEA